MPRYIDADEFKREMEKYLPEDRELALKVLKGIKTADVRAIVEEYCKKEHFQLVSTKKCFWKKVNDGEIH